MRNISNKKKILFIVPLPPPYAGPEIASEYLIDSPLKEGFEIICVRSNINRCNTQKGKITINSLGVLCLVMIRVIHVIIVKRPDTVYTLLSQNVSGFVRDSLLVLLVKAFRKKVILHLHGSNFHNFYNNQPAIFKKYIHLILNLADIIILQARWIKDEFKKLIPENRLRVIYGCVPTGISSGKDLYKKNHAGDGINILYLSHLSVAKGFSVFLKAMKEIIFESKDINFIIVGGVIDNEKNIFFNQNGGRIVFEDIRLEIKDIVKNKEFSERIRFLGEVTDKEQKQQILRMSDIFVLPSYSEGCPLSVLEAMTAGLPVVVTPVGALPEILKDGENGFFTKLGDHKELKDKIYSLAINPALRNIMGENNRKLIRSKLDINIIIVQLSEIFRQL